MPPGNDQDVMLCSGRTMIAKESQYLPVIDAVFGKTYRSSNAINSSVYGINQRFEYA